MIFSGKVEKNASGTVFLRYLSEVKHPLQTENMPVYIQTGLTRLLPPPPETCSAQSEGTSRDVHTVIAILLVT